MLSLAKLSVNTFPTQIIYLLVELIPLFEKEGRGEIFDLVAAPCRANPPSIPPLLKGEQNSPKPFDETEIQTL